MRMSYFWTAMVSGAFAASTRSSDARRLAVPVACGSSGLSGNRSNSPCPMTCSRVVWVAASRASVAATIVKRGASGSSTSRTSGDDSNSSRKSSFPPPMAPPSYATPDRRAGAAGPGDGGAQRFRRRWGMGEPNEAPFRFLFRVRYGECDQQNIVFNARWGDYIDIACTEYLRALFAVADS